jgi:Flp pilus assembly protein TadG
MKIMKFRKPFLKNDKGVAAIEMAFIMPFMLLLYFGLVDITVLISLNRKITSAASTTADLVTQQRSSVLKSFIDDTYKATAMIISPTPASEVRVEVFGFRNVGGTITKIWQTNNGTGPSCGAVPATTSMLPLMTAGNDVIVARSCMNFTPAVATFMGTNVVGATSFLLKQSISIRPRAALQLTCYQTTVAAGTVCS